MSWRNIGYITTTFMISRPSLELQHMDDVMNIIRVCSVYTISKIKIELPIDLIHTSLSSLDD